MVDAAGAQEWEGERRVSRPLWPRVLLALLLAVAGGSVAFFSTKPIYRSTAEVVYQGDQPELELLETIVHSSRSVEGAMDNSGWISLGRPVTPRTMDQFRSSVGVQRVSKFASTVTFDDPDPKAAQASLVALMNVWYSASLDRQRERMRLLADRATSRIMEVTSVKKRIRDMTDSSDAIEVDYSWKERLDELMRLKRLIDEAELAQITRPGATRPTTAPAALATLKARYQRESEELHNLSKTRAELDDLRAQANELQPQLTSAKEQVDRENMRAISPDRIRILSYGDLPGIPAIDARPRRAALGAGAGLAVFALLRLARRLRSRTAKSHRGAFPLMMPDASVPTAAVAGQVEC